MVVFIITLSIFFIACFMGGIHFYNFVTIRRRRIRAEIVSQADKTCTSTGTMEVAGVAGVFIEGVRGIEKRKRGSGTFQLSKARPGDRYDLIKKEKEPVKSTKFPTKRKSRYDLLKNKE